MTVRAKKLQIKLISQKPFSESFKTKTVSRRMFFFLKRPIYMMKVKNSHQIGLESTSLALVAEKFSNESIFENLLLVSAFSRTLILYSFKIWIALTRMGFLIARIRTIPIMLLRNLKRSSTK
jgi:hypothetical protein